MAELLAAGTALGVASSLLAFGDVAWRVLKRVKEYSETVENVPKVIKHIRAQLPVLIDKMEELKGNSDVTLRGISPHGVLAEAITGCAEQIKYLDELTAKMLPTKDDSGLEKAKKAIRSVRYETKITETWERLESYKSTFIFHFMKMTAVLKEISDTGSVKAVFLCPFERDPNFIGRQDILSMIDEHFARRNRVALAGIGGVG
jgi:hypothetical protein